MTIQKLLKDNTARCVGFLIILSLVIVFLWFKDGNYIGGGEEGLWLWNAARSLKLYSSGWTEYGSGFYIAAFLPRIPVLLAMSFLQMLFSPPLTQAILFFFLILSGLLGLFALCKELVGKNSTALLSAIFYFFNVFSMTQVWNRHIYAGFFSWAYLPIFLYLWVKWVRTRKIKYFALILAISIVYSVSFVTISYIFTIWIPLGIFILVEAIKLRKDKKALLVLAIQFVVTTLSWFLVNIWWALPSVASGAATVDLVNKIDNIGILKGVSTYFKNSDIFLLRQSYYLSLDNINEQFRSGFYLSVMAYALSIGALLITILGVITSIRKKYFVFVFVLFVASWFLIKGSNRPFGVEFYDFLFKNLSVTQMFRNPYEKLGIMFVLPYAIFFGIGLSFVTDRIKKYRQAVILGVLFLVCGVLVWPMWGHVYADFVTLKIPGYYALVNEEINKDTSDIRIINLPPINGEGSKFSWDYQGIVPYEFLFDKPTIARNIYIGDYYKKIYDAFGSNDISGIYEILDNLNIKYAIIHNDLDVSFNEAQNLVVTKALLDNSPRFKFLSEKGNLMLYRYESKNIGSRFIVSGDTPPQISYEIINPARYVVHINDAKGTYNLIFKETFNKNWEARIKDKVLIEHSQIYNFANMWKVTDLGDYKIEIVYKIWPWD